MMVFFSSAGSGLTSTTGSCFLTTGAGSTGDSSAFAEDSGLAGSTGTAGSTGSCFITGSGAGTATSWDCTGSSFTGDGTEVHPAAMLIMIKHNNTYR